MIVTMVVIALACSGYARSHQMMEVAPRAAFGGLPLLKGVVEIAAAYLYYLCCNHPFVDGNKRTALACCLVVLEANSRLADPGAPVRDIDAWESLVLDITASGLDREGTTKRLRALLNPPGVELRMRNDAVRIQWDNAA